MQAELCAALASPVRLQILELVSEGEKTSTQLQEILKLPKANLSQHLTVLKDAGIIQSRKEGLYQYMSLSLPRIKDACTIVKSVLAEKIEQEEKKHAELRRELKSAR
jgi:ArsR family transcriptional regulator